MCKVRFKVSGKRGEFLGTTIGYRGKREAESDWEDFKQARAIVVPKGLAKQLPRGQFTITVTKAIIRTKSGVRTLELKPLRLKVRKRRWSKGSALLVPEGEYPFARAKRR